MAHRCTHTHKAKTKEGEVVSVHSCFFISSAILVIHILKQEGEGMGSSCGTQVTYFVCKIAKYKHHLCPLADRSNEY